MLTMLNSYVQHSTFSVSMDQLDDPNLAGAFGVFQTSMVMGGGFAVGIVSTITLYLFLPIPVSKTADKGRFDRSVSCLGRYLPRWIDDLQGLYAWRLAQQPIERTLLLSHRTFILLQSTLEPEQPSLMSSRLRFRQFNLLPWAIWAIVTVVVAILGSAVPGTIQYVSFW
jgi:hypothetical protein